MRLAYNLNAMKLLARGGQADIYEIDAGRILRVLRTADVKDTAMLMQERSIMGRLRERGVDVPEIYEYTTVDGLPALAMERIAGPSMLDVMVRKPFAMRRLAGKLARLHGDFLGVDAPEGLVEIKERADFLVGRTNWLDDGDRAFVRSLLQELPSGDALLHGDFHPGNILTGGGKYYIIDWFGAAKGCYVSDIAHTYLLCANKPRIPGESDLAFRFLKMAATWFGRAYLKDMRARFGFDMDEFGKWLAVRAAERTAYGQPSELESRAAFVKACRKAREKGVPSGKWHTLL